MGFRRVSVSFGLVLAFAVSFALARDVERPPSEELAEPALSLVAGSVVATTGGAPIVLERLEVVRSSSLDEEGVRELTTAAGAGRMGFRCADCAGLAAPAGISIVLAVTRLREGRFPQPRLALDPAGWRVVELAGVGPAVFRDSPSLRQLLLADRDPGRWSDDEVGALVVSLLAAGDRASARLAALELALRPGIVAALRPEQHAAIHSVIANEASDPLVAEALVRAESGGHVPPWLLGAVRGILDRAGLAVPRGSAEAQLVHTALGFVGRWGGEPDRQRLTRHLYSSHPAVAQSAMLALAAAVPDRAEVEVQKALGTGALPEQSRRYFRSFLSRRGIGSPAAD